MAKKQFKTESKRILDLMINSIYTNREIFLRELISNASDALDKLYFKSLTNQKIKLNRNDFQINLSIDKDKRTLTVEDNGIGMTKDELENNLGTIAKSGSREFTSENEKVDDVDIIGQFGVGFYSAFMVAKKITVYSLGFGEKEANKWESSGVDGYTIEPYFDMKRAGTKIVLEIKDDTDEDDYCEFLDSYRISELVKKYSDYIRYPIKMDMEKTRKKEGGDEYETYTENAVLNTMIPIWKRAKKEVTDEEYKSFYCRFYDNKEPISIIHQHAEGSTEYYALLFIPEKPDFDYYTKDFERGVTLYTSNVLIMEKCSGLLPEYFGFVKGLVDSQDLSLNISRETLQKDGRLAIIRNAIEKRIKKELVEMMANDREKYEKFFDSFGLTLKYGIYKSFGAAKETLEELLIFRRASDGKYVSLKEYRDAMPENQEKIYYAAGESFEKLSKLPQAELVRDKGFDLLCMTDEVDEFLAGMLGAYDGKTFLSISSGDLGLETEEEKKELEKKSEESKDLFECMKNALDGKVSEVRVSTRLKSHPVCLTSEGAISLEMEKVLSAIPGSEKELKATRVLEINSAHPIFETLNKLFETDKDKVGRYAKLLYNQALLIEGLPIEDAVEFSNLICELM